MMWRRILAARVSPFPFYGVDSEPWACRGAASLRAPPAELHNYGMYDWNDLRYFLAVAREGSTLSAAKVLRVNQSTVHRHMSALEKDLGCKLVERHPTGYRLTDLGKELQVHAERMDESAAALTRHIASSAKGMTGCIRVTCSTAVGHRLMKSGILDRFSGRYPGLGVELIMTEQLSDLSKGEADIAIRGGEPSDESLVGKKMADVPWGIYATRSYVERYGRPRLPGDLNSHRVIRFAEGLANHRAARWLKLNAPHATVCGESGNIPSVLLAVKSGAGVAHLPAPVGDSDPELVCVLGPLKELSSAPSSISAQRSSARY
jgi:DNA-binding transcriptional LysR family regulator